MLANGRVVFGQMDEVRFGVPAAKAVAEQATRLGAERVFLMVSGTLNRATEEIARVRDALGKSCAGLFDAMPAHSPRSAVIAASEQARAVATDLIVTVGGGSITDAAKAVQLCLANDVRRPEDMDRLRTIDGVSPDIQPPAVRQVSVPTTLSAGEFSSLAGVTDERTRVKELFRHPRIIPAAVILDPAITVHTPEWLFLSTGIRAVDHCVEGICSREANPYADAQALRGLSLLAGGLPRVKANPGDLAARLDCQMGAWLSMGPLASGVPMGASHGIGYVLGAVYDVPHGHTSCIMLPAVMRWNKVANADRQALVAEAMVQARKQRANGEHANGEHASAENGRGGDVAADAAELLDRLIGGLGLPRSLAAVNIGAAAFDRIAEGALKTPWVPRNPRPIDGPAAVREILHLAA